MNQKKNLIFITFLTFLTVVVISLTSFFIIKNEKIQQNVKAVSLPTSPPEKITVTPSPTPEITNIMTITASPSSALIPTN